MVERQVIEPLESEVISTDTEIGATGFRLPVFLRQESHPRKGRKEHSGNVDKDHISHQGSVLNQIMGDKVA